MRYKLCVCVCVCVCVCEREREENIRKGIGKIRKEKKAKKHVTKQFFLLW